MADATATPRPGAAAPPGSARLVCFLLHGQEYAADIGGVIETLVVRPITRVFLTPAWLAGIMNLRGDVIAVFDLAALLGLGPTLVSDDSRVMLARHEGHRAGLLVDALAELRVLDLGRLEPPTATSSPDGASFLRGLVTLEDGGVVRVLDLAALFASERVRTLQAARPAAR